MKKGTHPENYRLVAFKDMSNEDVLSLNLLGNKRNNYS
jgi:ribosomal protein L31